MKVICINDTWIYYLGTPKDTPHPNFGDVDEVISTQEFCGVLFYALAGYGVDSYFRNDHFAPLSDIDETEMVRENILQTQNG